MAHMMKYTKASCGHMFAHFDRTAENISNENLDRARTYLNYNLALCQQMKQGEFVKKRCSEVHCQNRKDLNVMVSWIITAPKDLPEQEYKVFFQASYDFLKERYGVENVISSWVHMDEVQPHMHFAFVPVVQTLKRDRKNSDILIKWNKVSAKECVNRSDLQSFHMDLQKYVECVLGHEVSILNEATKEGNKSIEELKRQSASQRLQKINTEASKIIINTQERLNVLQRQEKTLKGQIKGLQRDLLTAKQVKKIPHSKSLIGDKQLVSTADFDILCRTAAIAEELLKEIEPAREVNTLAEEIIDNAYKQAKEIIKVAQNKAGSISEHMDSFKYREKLKYIEKVIDSDPQLAEAYYRAEKNLQNKEYKKQVQHFNKNINR